MTPIYDIITRVKDFLYAHPIVNHVTFGDIMDVDLAKTTIYPLSHFNISQANLGSNFISVDMSFLFLDIVDYTKDFREDKDFRDDQTNIVDILNTQLQIANEFVGHLRRGDLYTEKYQLEGDPVCRVFRDKYENQLAGWRVDATILIPNSINIC